MAFQVGQLVVCVGEDGPRTGTPYGEAVPQRGIVYTIRDAFVCPFRQSDRLLLEEIVNPPHGYCSPETMKNGVWEANWSPSGFRPLSQTRLSVFTSMLNSVPKEVVG